MFRHVSTAELAENWGRIGVMLVPAVRHNPNGTTLRQVFESLMSGRCHCFEVAEPEVSGVIVFEIFDEGGKVKCFSSYVAGRAAGPPRRWLATLRATMARFEQMLTEAGCEENYIGGRDWSRVFPDYEPVDDVPNRRRKVL